MDTSTTMDKSELITFMQVYLRYFDPVLSAGKSSDLYDEVVKSFVVYFLINKLGFKDALVHSFEDNYGKHWLQNKNINIHAMFEILAVRYSDKFEKRTHKELLPRKNGSVWHRAACKFIAWPANDIFIGKNYYITKDGEQTIKLHSNHVPSETYFAHLGNDLGLRFDHFGRVVSPTHYLDNLFLENMKSHPITMPKNVTWGRVYITHPAPEIIAEALYIESASLNNLLIDKTTNVLQFGSTMGSENIEVASGFILSLHEGELVNAWIKLENIRA